MSIITKSIIVKIPAEQAYYLWSDFENFPLFMNDVKQVSKTGPKTSRWIIKGPLGKELEWSAQITDLQPNKRIAWNTMDGNIKTSGSVTFDALDMEHTQITVIMQYVPPAGKLGEASVFLLDDPERRLDEDLKRFKLYAESPSRV